MRKDTIRPVAICVFRNNDRILVSEGVDAVKQETFYRPLGGTIEFGERGEETIHRELREEINAEVTNLRYLGLLENMFVYNAMRGHELILVYDGEFVDPSLYEKTVIFSDELGSPIRAIWIKLSELGPQKPPLYPLGLLELLQKG